MKKELYTKPTSEIFELKFEGNVLQTNSPVSPVFGNNGSAGGDEDYNNQGEF